MAKKKSIFDDMLPDFDMFSGIEGQDEGEAQLDKMEAEAPQDSMSKKKKNHRRVTEMIEIPEKMLLRKAYGLTQFLDCLRFEAPRPGYSIHVITGGNVDMICYLRWILLHFQHMKRVLITTWCLGGAELLMMKEWYEKGVIEQYDMLVGEHCKNQYKVEWGMLQDMQNKGIVRHLYCSTIHTKIILCDTGKEKLTVETSSNFNMNPRVEQGVVTMNSDLFDFYDKYFMNLITTENIKQTSRELKELSDDD